MLNKKKNTTKESKVGAKKVTRRKRKTSSSPIDSGIHDIDQVYKALNRVQVTREPVIFIIADEDTPVVNNILKDVQLPFKVKAKKSEGKICTEYSVSPGVIVPRTDHLDDIEELPDELIEDGQVF